MTDKHCKNETTVNGGAGWIAAAIILLAVAGEPDLWDATMYYLTGNECYLEGGDFDNCTPGGQTDDRPD